MVNFHRDLVNLGERAAMLFALIRENDDTTRLHPLLDKHHDPVLPADEYFHSMEQHEARIRQTHNALDQELFAKYYSTVEEYYIQWEQIYIYLQRVEAFLDNLGEKYLEFQSVDELLSCNKVDRQVQIRVYELLHHYLVMALLSETQLRPKAREQLVVFYYRHSHGKHINFIKQVRQLTCALDLSGLSPAMTLNKQLNRLHLPKRIITNMLKHLLSTDVYESPCRHSNPYYQVLHRNRLICSYILSLLHDPKQPFTTHYDLDRQFLDFPYHEIYDSFFVNVSQLFTRKKSIYKAQEQYKSIQEMHNQIVVYNETLNLPLNQLTEVVHFVYETNITIRQYLIHYHFNKQKKQKIEVLDAIHALLALSELEQKLDRQYSAQIACRETQYQNTRDTVGNRLNDLVQYFCSPDQPDLCHDDSVVAQQGGLSGYFSKLKESVMSLSIQQDNFLLKQQVMQGLRNVLKYKSLQDNLQMVSYVEQSIKQLQELILLQKTKENLIGGQLSIDSYLVELLEDHMEVVQLCLEGGHQMVEGLLYRLARIGPANRRRVQEYLQRMVVKVGQLIAQQLVAQESNRYDQIQLINRISHQVNTLLVLKQYTYKDPQVLLEQTIQRLLRNTLANQYSQLEVSRPQTIQSFLNLQQNILSRLQMTQDLLQVQAGRFYHSISQSILVKDKVVDKVLLQLISLLGQPKTFYLKANMTFYSKQYVEVLGAPLFYKLVQVLGVDGLKHMDSLLGTRLTGLLDSLHKGPSGSFKECFHQVQHLPPDDVSQELRCLLEGMAKKNSKQVSYVGPVLVEVGRLVTLRLLVQQTVRLECEKRDPVQVALLSQINKQVLQQVHMVPKETLLRIQQHSHQVGLHSVHGKVYSTLFLRDQHWVFMQVLALLLDHLPSLSLHKVSSSVHLLCIGPSFDSTLLAQGIRCLLDQYYQEEPNLMDLLRRYVQSSTSPKKNLLASLVELI